MRKIVNVAVGVSGGVDSAVAALLLKERGFNVTGVFMRNWDEKDETGVCSVSQDCADAEYVCHQLNIPFKEVNFVKAYWNHVFSYLLKEYQTGNTPNPDIMCNRHIKFSAFLEHCLGPLGMDAVATGHYARATSGETSRLLEAHDKFKDQTFFLCQIKQSSLKHVLFPLGHLMKTQVKQIASKYGLDRIAKKRESTGICFIGKRNFQDFISEYLPENPGPVIDVRSGKKIDMHRGLHMWTIGQCCRIEGFNDRYFVASKITTDNSMYVVPGSDHPALFTSILYTTCFHWIRGYPSLNLFGVMACHFRFQHTKPLVPCKVLCSENGAIIILERPLKAITPGQFAVLYKNGECLGGGRILSPGPSLFSLNISVPPDYREYEHFTRPENVEISQL